MWSPTRLLIGPRPASGILSHIPLSPSTLPETSFNAGTAALALSTSVMPLIASVAPPKMPPISSPTLTPSTSTLGRLALTLGTSGALPPVSIFQPRKTTASMAAIGKNFFSRPPPPEAARPAVSPTAPAALPAAPATFPAALPAAPATFPAALPTVPAAPETAPPAALAAPPTAAAAPPPMLDS